MIDCKFADPPNSAAFVTADVLSGEASVVFVVRDEVDGSWQFLPALVSGDPKIIGLREMVSIDPSINELFDLQPGTCARRESLASPWVRSKHGGE